MKEGKSTEDSRTPIKISRGTVIGVIDLDDGYATEVAEGTPLRPIFCLKKKDDIKKFEKREECFILDFDPDEPVVSSTVKKLSNGDSPDLAVIAEKGQVACRDYPHSRHLCVKHPFKTTPHESYCKLCYCYVCDISAPCKKWSAPEGHCHAIDNPGWKLVRRTTKQLGLRYRSQTRNK